MPTTRVALPPAQRRRGLARIAAVAAAVATIAAASFLSPAAASHRATGPLASLSDVEFWDFFTKMSEPGGTFVSENFVSNEASYQHVIPTLQRTLTKNGVYLGVGPEQNLTYIANLHPRLAVIIDIRRQNAMQHLMFKALFELAPTRAEFVSRLFARPLPKLDPGASAQALFDSAEATLRSEADFHTNYDDIIRTLTRKHHFALSKDDIAMIDHVYRVFVEAGPDVNYGYHSGSGMPMPSSYPTFASLQEETNADSVPMAFLASEENYRAVRDLERRNLVIPVVGDFGGPKAIRAVGDWLHRHDLTVTTFYLSNVEQYLFRSGDAAALFYGNVASLPIDSTSTFIRSVPGTGFGSVAVSRRLWTVPRVIVPGTTSVGGLYAVTILDSNGVRMTSVTQDSAGHLVTHTTADSSVATPSLRDSTRLRATLPDSLSLSLGAFAFRRDTLKDSTPLARQRPAFVISRVMGSLLASGLASMHETLDAFFAGQLTSYSDAIRMTKVEPDRPR
jgi:hypothetical protein